MALDVCDASAAGFNTVGAPTVYARVQYTYPAVPTAQSGRPSLWYGPCLLPVAVGRVQDLHVLSRSLPYQYGSLYRPIYLYLIQVPRVVKWFCRYRGIGAYAMRISLDSSYRVGLLLIYLLNLRTALRLKSCV